MNSCVGMTMVKKEQGQDDQQSELQAHITRIHIKCYQLSEDICRLVM